MSDPVASKSTFLCMYMTNHPDTLVAYVKHFGKIPSNVSSARMKSIDSKGMNLSYSLTSGGVGSVRVKFDPPLAGYEEVKPRLLAMKADAQEALGMLEFPKITSFRLPFRLTPVIYLLIGTAYVGLAPFQKTFVPPASAHIADIIFMPARTIWSVLGLLPPLKSIAQFITAIHALECFYTWYLCRRYVHGTPVTGAYLVATLIVGFPIWVDLKKRVREKRIESVMKAE